MIDIQQKFEDDIKGLYKQGMKKAHTQQENCKDIKSNLDRPFWQVTQVMRMYYRHPMMQRNQKNDDGLIK